MTRINIIIAAVIAAITISLWWLVNNPKLSLPKGNTRPITLHKGIWCMSKLD